MSVLNEIGNLMRRPSEEIDAYKLAENLARRIQQGEYWEDVAIEMQEKHPDVSWEMVEKEFEELEGTDIASYATDAETEDDEGWTDPAGGYHPGRPPALSESEPKTAGRVLRQTESRRIQTSDRLSRSKRIR